MKLWIFKAGGSFKRAEAVRPGLKRRASRQAAAARGRSRLPIFGFFIVALPFSAWRGSLANLFRVPNGSAVHRRGAAGAMTTDVR